MRWAPVGSAGDCEHPLEAFDAVTKLNGCYVRCRSTRASVCSTCAARHRKNVARVGRSGWIDRPGDRGYFVTLTAPGSDVLPWDKSQCVHGDEIECSGALGCRCEIAPLREWNDSLGLRWSRFVQYVREYLPGVDVQFFKTYEPQKRGAQHAHIMFRFVGVVSDRRIRAALRLSAHRWGFGKQLQIDVVDLGSGLAVARTAGYCAKYASKSSDADRSMIDTSTGEIIKLHLRAWSKSDRWGETMRSIRHEQRCWAVTGGGRPEGGLPVPLAAAGRLDLNSDFYTGGVIKTSVCGSIGSAGTM